MIMYETSLVLLGFGSVAMRLYDHNPAVGYSGLIQFREERTGQINIIFLDLVLGIFYSTLQRLLQIKLA